MLIWIHIVLSPIKTCQFIYNCFIDLLIISSQFKTFKNQHLGLWQFLLIIIKSAVGRPRLDISIPHRAPVGSVGCGFKAARPLHRNRLHLDRRIGIRTELTDLLITIDFYLFIYYEYPSLFYSICNTLMLRHCVQLIAFLRREIFLPLTSSAAYVLLRFRSLQVLVWSLSKV